MSADDDENSVFEMGFDPIPLAGLPSGRLQDIMKLLEDKNPAVLTLDSLIFNDSTVNNPKAEALGLRVLQTFLYHIKPSVKTLSLRYNMLTLEAQDYLIDWIVQNDWIEILYLQGTGFDSKKKEALKAAWKKNLSSQRTDNFDQTFIRFTNTHCNFFLYLKHTVLIFPPLLFAEYLSILMHRSRRKMTDKMRDRF